MRSLDKRPPTLFLALPAEIRNAIYALLQPEHAYISEIQGMMWSCRQIARELAKTITDGIVCVLHAVEKDSIALRQTTLVEGGIISLPYIIVPTVDSMRCLRNITISICLTYHPHRKREPGTKAVYFGKVLCNLARLLALHLEYVTIALSCIMARGYNIWMPQVRSNLLENCRHAFKEVRKRSQINARYIVFDVIHEELGPFPQPGHRPALVFVRHEMKLSPGARYAMLGHDPRLEIPEACRLLGTEYEIEENMMLRLDEVLRASRR